MDRDTKKEVVAELHGKLKDAKLAILADYSGMSVAKITALRNELRKTGTEFRVVKNTLLKIASENTRFSNIENHLKGPLAIAVNSGDVVEPAKVLVDYARKNSELEIKFGVLEGKFLDKAQIDALSELPGKEVLIAKLLSVFVGAQAGLVTVLNGVPRGFVQALNAYRMKKEKQS
ncbi:MAG: 50S ribosomal protein L10 [Syntrophales bacterium]